MKTSLLTLLPLVSCLLVYTPVSAETNRELLDKYYGLFDSDDGTSLIAAWQSFAKEVPPTDRQELFALMIDRASKNPKDSAVIANIIYAVYSDGPSVPMSPHLERSVLAQATHRDSNVRGLLVEALAAKGPQKYRNLCLSFLDDPNDDVRMSAVDSIGKWPDGKDILNKYVQAHDSQADHSRSVQRVKQLMIVSP